MDSLPSALPSLSDWSTIVETHAGVTKSAAVVGGTGTADAPGKQADSQITRKPYCIMSMEDDLKMLRKDNLNLRLRIYLHEEHSPENFAEYKIQMEDLISRLNTDMHADNEYLRKQLALGVNIGASHQDGQSWPLRDDQNSDLDFASSGEVLREAHVDTGRLLDLSSFRPSFVTHDKIDGKHAESKDESCLEMNSCPMHSTVTTSGTSAFTLHPANISAVDEESEGLRSVTNDTDHLNQLKEKDAKIEKMMCDLNNKTALLRQLGDKFDELEATVGALINDNTAKNDDIKQLTTKLDARTGQLSQLTAEYNRLKAQTRRHLQSVSFVNHHDHPTDDDRSAEGSDGLNQSVASDMISPSIRVDLQSVCQSMWKVCRNRTARHISERCRQQFKCMWTSHEELICRLEETGRYLQQSITMLIPIPQIIDDNLPSMRSSSIYGGINVSTAENEQTDQLHDMSSDQLDRLSQSVNNTLQTSRRVSKSFEPLNVSTDLLLRPWIFQLINTSSETGLVDEHCQLTSAAFEKILDDEGLNDIYVQTVEESVDRLLLIVRSASMKTDNVLPLLSTCANLVGHLRAELQQIRDNVVQSESESSQYLADLILRLDGRHEMSTTTEHPTVVDSNGQTISDKILAFDCDGGSDPLHDGDNIDNVLCSEPATGQKSRECCDCKERVSHLKQLLQDTEVRLATMKSQERDKAARLDRLRRGAVEQMAKNQSLLDRQRLQHQETAK